MPKDANSPTLEAQPTLQAALGDLLQPLARLALAHGLQYQTLDALLRAALVKQARELLDNGRSHGLVSRVSTATGLTRREVGHLLNDGRRQQQPSSHSRASEVFARWLSDPDYQRDGVPLVLPHSGAAPSFDALARSVTQDVHPRSLLDELRRLDLVALNAESDTVALQKDTFVPHADAAQMLALLADNVSDHLEAAVTNVLGHDDEHFEQALYADELSAESVQALRPLIAAEWSQLFQRMAPALERCLAADRAHGRQQDQRVRIGFYSFAAPMDAQAVPAGGKPAHRRADSTARDPDRMHGARPSPGPVHSS